MACRDLNSQMANDPAESLGLIIGTDGRKLAAHGGRRAVAAAADIIDSQHRILARIDAEPRSHHFRPPALARRAGDDAMRGDSAEHDDHGPLPVAHESKRYPCIRQRIAVVQIEGRETQSLIDWIEEIFDHELRKLLKGNYPWSIGS